MTLNKKNKINKRKRKRKEDSSSHLNLQGKRPKREERRSKLDHLPEYKREARTRKRV